MKSPVLASILLALALAACATPAAYAPAARAGGAGFSDTRIETDRFRVTFRGAGAGDVVENFALRRAAEITLAERRDWFIVDARSLDREASAAPRTSISIGAGGFSGGRTSVGAGASVGIPLCGAGWAVARLDIRLGAGPKPADPQAYDARMVLANLGPR